MCSSVETMEHPIPNSGVAGGAGAGVGPSGRWRDFVVYFGHEIGFKDIEGFDGTKAKGRGSQPHEGAGNADAEDGVFGVNPGTAICTYRQRWTLRLYTGGWAPCQSRAEYLVKSNLVLSLVSRKHGLRMPLSLFFEVTTVDRSNQTTHNETVHP